MSESPPDAPDGVTTSPELWTKIQDDVTEVFGDDADVTVTEYENHLDVRVMPNRAVSQLEAEHEDLTIVPYNACQMTIRKDR